MSDAVGPDRFLARRSKRSGPRDFRWLETLDRQNRVVLADVAVVSWTQPRPALPTIGSGICRGTRNRTSCRHALWRSPYNAWPSFNAKRRFRRNDASGAALRLSVAL